jgi:hypothetical protein
VDDRGVHNLYKHLVSSGHAFGAKRWVATLNRQCERLASAMATNIPAGDAGGNIYYVFFLKELLLVTIVLIDIFDLGLASFVYSQLLLIKKEERV